ncbi:MAG: Ldh family oxidoreductase [Verrucomicrobiota bacterium]
MEQLYVIKTDWHDQVVQRAFEKIGYSPAEVHQVVRNCRAALENGVRTHNAIKAIHLEALFGVRQGGTTCGANILKQKRKFSAVKFWDAQKKIGPAVAYEAVDECAAMAEDYGVGVVAVDNAWHYFWGGGYVLELAQRGFIGFTICTALLAEVVPYGGSKPVLGTNPHSWGLPTQEVCGFPVLVDWATSVISMGKAQQLAREGKSLPYQCAVNQKGNVTNDPKQIAGLLPFGLHKGYGLSLINELIAGIIGGWKPTERGRFAEGYKKSSTTFLFLALHPEAIEGNFVSSDRKENLKSIVNDILCKENQGAILPGQLEYEARCRCQQAGGLLLTEAEFNSFNEIAKKNQLDTHSPVRYRS